LVNPSRLLVRNSSFRLADDPFSSRIVHVCVARWAFVGRVWPKACISQVRIRLSCCLGHIDGRHAKFRMGGDLSGFYGPRSPRWARLTGYDLLLWHTEEDALEADQGWRSGNYIKSPPLPVVEALQQMNTSAPSCYAPAHPPEKFAADYAQYAVIGIARLEALLFWVSVLFLGTNRESRSMRSES
jgi:hypothetical protein